jgi:hypothetical protein
MKYYIIVFIALLGFTSCAEFENSATKSEITYLPKIEIFGDSFIELECDEVSYEDEGAEASEGGEVIAHNTDVIGLYFGSPDVDGADMYWISYSATNVDGIPGIAVREVYWPECNGDLVTSIAGMYKMTVARNGATPVGYSDNGPFFIVDLGNDEYALSDGMGGWYEHGRGFGPIDGPALGMTVIANDIPSNDFTFGPDFTQAVFGGNVEIESFSVDAGAGTITFQTYWDFGFTFVVTLTQCPEGVPCWN